LHGNLESAEEENKKSRERLLLIESELRQTRDRLQMTENEIKLLRAEEKNVAAEELLENYERMQEKISENHRKIFDLKKKNRRDFGIA